MKPYFAAALVLSAVAAPAVADEPRNLGTPQRGLYVILEPGGRISVNTDRSIRLNDGREIRRGSDGVWSLTPESLASPREFSSLDFALHAPELEGQRVRVTGGRIFSARVDRGSLKLQGGFAGLVFAGVDPQVLRAVVQQCADLMTGPACDVTITGQVQRSATGEPRLLDLVINGPRLQPAR